eukprot:gene8198-5799_t
MEDHVSRLCELPHILQKDRGIARAGSGAPFFAELRGGAGGQDPFTAFLYHDHYVWHSARPRAQHGTMRAWHLAAVQRGLAADEP